MSAPQFVPGGEGSVVWRQEKIIHSFQLLVKTHWTKPSLVVHYNPDVSSKQMRSMRKPNYYVQQTLKHSGKRLPQKQ